MKDRTLSDLSEYLTWVAQEYPDVEAAANYVRAQVQILIEKSCADCGQGPNKGAIILVDGRRVHAHKCNTPSAGPENQEYIASVREKWKAYVDSVPPETWHEAVTRGLDEQGSKSAAAFENWEAQVLNAYAGELLLQDAEDRDLRLIADGESVCFKQGLWTAIHFKPSFIRETLVPALLEGADLSELLENAPFKRIKEGGNA